MLLSPELADLLDQFGNPLLRRLVLEHLSLQLVTLLHKLLTQVEAFFAPLLMDFPNSLHLALVEIKRLTQVLQPRFCCPQPRKTFTPGSRALGIGGTGQQRGRYRDYGQD
jgi:hypothetical protein